MLGDHTVSGFVITQDEEANIRDCLESMAWADELVVVDSGSEDATVEIAQEYTDRVIHHDFAGHVGQTRYAFEQTTCEWVIWLDADERLTDNAFQDLRSHFERPEGPGCDGFTFPRKTHFLGRWITHGGWYPQRKLRVMRRVAARIQGDEPHPEAVVEGAVRAIKGDILHCSYPGGILDYVRRSGAYADIAARARLQSGRRAGLADVLFRPTFAFLRSYVLKLGFLDGLPGLAVAVGTAYHRFVRELRLRELQRETRTGGEG